MDILLSTQSATEGILINRDRKNHPIKGENMAHDNEHCKAENCTCDPCECTEEQQCDCE